MLSNTGYKKDFRDTAKKTSVSKTEIGRIRDTFGIKVQDTKRGRPSALTEKEPRKAVQPLQPLTTLSNLGVL